MLAMMRFQVLLVGVLLMCFINETHAAKASCNPKVTFKSCEATNGKYNPKWGVPYHSNIVFNLDLKPDCRNSRVKIQWKLFGLESGNLLEDWPFYANKIRAVVTPRSLPLGEYVVKATVREAALHKTTGKSTAECWFKITGLKGAFALQTRLVDTSLTTAATRLVCRRNCRESTGQRAELSVNPMSYLIIEYHIDDKLRDKSTFVTGIFRWQHRTVQRRREKDVVVTGHKLKQRVCKFEPPEDPATFFGKKRKYGGCIKDPAKDSCLHWTTYETTVQIPDIKDRAENERKDQLDFMEDGIVWKKKLAVDRAHTIVKGSETRQRMFITYQASGHPISYLVMDFHEDEAQTSTYYLIGIRDAKVEFHDYLITNFVIIPHYRKEAEDPPYPYDYKIAPYKPKDDRFSERLRFAKALYGVSSNKFKKLVIPGGPEMLLSSGRIDEALDMIHTLLFLLNCDNSLPDKGDKADLDLYYDFMIEIKDDMFQIVAGIGDMAGNVKAVNTDLYHIMKMVAMLPRLRIPAGINKQLVVATHQIALVDGMLSTINLYFGQFVKEEGMPKDRPMRYNEFYMNAFYNPLLLALNDLFEKNYVMPSVTFHEPSSSVNPYHKAFPEDYPDYGDYLDDSTRAECALVTKTTVEMVERFAWAMGLFHPFGEPEIRNSSKNNELYLFVEENLRMVTSLDFVVAGIKFTMQPTINFNLYDEETIGFVMVVKPSAYFWARIRTTFPIVVTYVYSRWAINSGSLESKKEFERPSHVSFTYKDDIVKFEHYQFAGLGSDVDTWNVDLVNSNMVRLRAEVSEDVLLMISIKNFSGFANTTSDRVMVTLMDTKYPKFPDHFKKNATESKKLFVYTETSNVHFYWHKGTARFLYVAIVPTNAPFVDAQTSAPPADVGPTAFPGMQLLQFEEYQDDKPAEGAAEGGGGEGEGGGEGDAGEGGSTMGLGFDLAIAVYQCLSWDEEDWKFSHSDDCQVPEGLALSLNSIKCACIGPDVLLPEVRNVRAITLNTTRLHLELKFQVDWTVFTVTLIVFFLYCLLLLLATSRLKPVLNLCYLGDNLKADRTAYLIVVRTKDVPEAGTTSNVMMKVHGRSTTSKSFVLNYPDPDRRLLQMGCEDAFVLTTEQNLGRIRYIEVWTDVIGFCPGWKCESIRIYDLRRNKEYYFDVQEQFTLREDEKCYRKISPIRKGQTSVKPKAPFDYLATHFGPAHTFNILDSSKDFEFHYICRITLILSHVTTALAVTLLLVGHPSMNLMDSLGFNPFTRFWLFISYVFMVAAAANIPHFLISVVFRNSSYYGLMRYRVGRVSGCVTVFAWIVLVLIITCGMIYLLVCGWWLPDIAVPAFLVIASLALIVDIFIFENVLMSIYNFSTMKSRFSTVDIFKEYDLVNVVLEAEQQRRFLYRRISIWGMRPFFKHLYRPLKGDIMKERKFINQSRCYIRRNVQSIMFLLFLGLFVYLLFYVHSEPHSAVMNKHMADLFVYGICSHCTNKTDISDIHKTIYEVRTLEDIYKYLNNTVAFVTMNSTWYDGYRAIDPGLIIDFQTKVVGVSRVRQVMVSPAECPDEEMSLMFDVKECLPAFDSSTSLKNEEKSKSMHAFQTYEGYSFMYGKMVESYDGDGYCVKMGRKYRNAVFTVTLIESADWFVKKTRAVIVELWTYNANTGLFTDIRILFERGPMQHIQASYRISSVQLGFTDHVLELFSVAVFTVTLFMVGIFAVTVLGHLMAHRFHFFMSFWNLMDVTILILCVLMLVAYISKALVEDETFEKMGDTRQNEFLPYFPMFHYVDTIQTMLGLVVFFCLIRALEIIQYTNRFRINNLVFKKAYEDCFALFTLMLMAFFALTVAACLILVDHPITSATVGDVLVANLRIMYGMDRAFSKWIETDSDGSVMYWYYAALGTKVIVLFSLCNLTCMHVYKEMKRKWSGQKWTYTLMTYAKEYAYYYSQFCWRSVVKPVGRGLGCVRGGGAEWHERPIMAKEDKYRYEKVKKLAGSKVNLMRLCLLATVRNTVVRRGTKLTAHDYNIMQELSKAVYAKRHPWYGRSGALDDPTHKFYFLVREKGKERMKARMVEDRVMDEMEMTSSYFTTTLLMEQEKSIAESTQITVPDLLSLGRMETILRSLVALDLLFENISVDIDPKYERESSDSGLNVQEEESEDSIDESEYEEDEDEDSEADKEPDDWRSK